MLEITKISSNIHSVHNSIRKISIQKKQIQYYQSFHYLIIINSFNYQVRCKYPFSLNLCKNEFSSIIFKSASVSHQKDNIEYTICIYNAIIQLPNAYVLTESVHVAGSLFTPNIKDTISLMVQSIRTSDRQILDAQIMSF